MTYFKRTNAKVFAKPSQIVTPDTIYWKQLGVPTLLKEFGPINYIDFSPVEPYHFAVQIYNPITKIVHKTLSKFRENAYGGSFRQDGKLLCVGGEEPVVKLFDVQSKSLLRVFRGHTGAIRRCFFTSDNTHIASFSDDKTVKIWDIPCEEKIHEFTQHDDYVRAGAVSPVSPTTILSGSYDKKIRMFDTRTNEQVFSVDHGHPVESLLFLPSGGIFISAGGNEMRVWDALAGGRLLARISQHHKTITCLCLGSNNTRLLSGSLDRHVKIYDVSTYKVVHNIDYSNAILSLGVSANDDTLAVGTVDGIVSVRRKNIENVDIEKPKKDKKSYRFAADKVSVRVDTVITTEMKQAVSKSDACLRKFQYKKALEVILTPYFTNKHPEVTISTLQELLRRKGLENAIRNGNDKTLKALISFLLKYLGDYRFIKVLIDVSNVVVDVYEEKISQCSPEIFEMIKRLHKRVVEEVELTKELLGISGSIAMLLSASINSKSTAALPTVAPSQEAQKNLILNVS